MMIDDLKRNLTDGCSNNTQISNIYIKTSFVTTAVISKYGLSTNTTKIIIIHIRQ